MTALNACGDGEPVEWWSPEMYGVVGRLAAAVARRGRLEADDVAQDVYLALLLYARREGERPVSAKLIHGVARRRVHLARREAARAGRDSAGRPWADRPETDADAVLDVRAAVAGLPPKYGEVVRGRWFEHESFERLAEGRGRRPGTTKDLQKKAFSLLRGGLGPSYGRDAARKRTTPPDWDAPRSRVHRPSNRRTDWTKWGRIPDQKEDDRE